MNSKTWFPTWQQGSKGECPRRKGAGRRRRERKTEKKRLTETEKETNGKIEREEGKVRGEGQRKPRQKPYVLYDLV